MDGSLPHHLASQHLDPNLDPSLTYPQFHHGQAPLASHIDLDTDPFQFASQLDHQQHLQHLQPRLQFDQRPPPPPAGFQEIQPNVRRSEHSNNDFNRSGSGGQFGVLTPHPQLPSQPSAHHEALARLQNEIDLRPVAVPDGGTTEGHFSNMRIVPDPPDLEEWRRKLFNVDDMLTLTEEE